MRAMQSDRSRIPWSIRMAWRDSRGKRRLLFFFTLSVIFGIGSIVAIESLRDNLSTIVEEESKTLLGADLSLRSRQAFTPEMDQFINELGGQVVRETRFRSMARFPKSGQSRFVQVRALDGNFPFYGSMESRPPNPGIEFSGNANIALVEESLMLQNSLSPGDTVRLGDAQFEIAGSLIRISGESEIAGFFAPRIYIPHQSLAAAHLLERGSVASFRAYFKFENGLSDRHREVLESAEKDLFVEKGIRYQTVEDRKDRIENVLDNLFNFLSLIGFIALLLGGVGIAAAVQVFIQSKRESIAVLRCLGVTSGMALRIYLIQVLAFGTLGAFIGTLIGIGIQFILPGLLSDFLPFPVEIHLSPKAILTGLAFGFASSSLFATLPLLSIRNISPMRAIRFSVEDPHHLRKDPLFWIITTMLTTGALAFTWVQTGSFLRSSIFLAGLALALGLLSLVALLLRGTLRRMRISTLPYSLRIALSNLYRPNNRTLLLVVTLGMGTLLINTLFLVRGSLLEQVNIRQSDDAPNVVMIDIQPDQRDPVKSLLQEHDFPVISTLPMVTMRVQSVKEKSLQEWKNTPDSPIDDWVYAHEFRNTFRDHVLDNAELIDGEFVGHYEGSEPYPISVAENLLDDLGVQLGDSITWNVQGVPVKTTVSSIRSVDWRADRQNFGIVFPRNTIENAPVTYIITTRADSRNETARLHSLIGEQFSNLSLIDLSLVFETLGKILDQAAFVIQFMALFTIATGLIVLAGTILSSRYQRIEESVLFRTMGASAAFIRSVLGIEFLVLGLLGGLAGTLLSYASTWAILHFVFERPFHPEFLPSCLFILIVMTLTLLTGLITSRGIANNPPLHILRNN